MILLGEGTVGFGLFDRLRETRREVLLIPASDTLSHTLHTTLSAAFRFTERNRGVAFTVPFDRWQGGAGEGSLPALPPVTHHCLVAVVNKGRSRACIRAARAAGATGGTVVHGWGAGIPVNFYVPLIIEPQKDVVLIITACEHTEAIKHRIFAELDLGRVGQGILFTLPVTQTSGLLESAVCPPAAAESEVLS